MSERILAVDDEPDLLELVEYNLREAGYAVTTAKDGAGALAEVRRQRPDLILLDLMLPDLSGTEVCKRLRRDPDTETIPIVMLTARGQEIDRVVGLELGADDYIVKPFSPRELVLRVGAVLRRAHAPQASEPSQRLVLGKLSIDTARHRVAVDDDDIPLTALEFKLLLDLASRRGRVQSRDALLDRVWGYSPGIETRTVDTHVKRLREKLGAAGDYIETVRGVGYRLREDLASLASG
jgi:two-component system phosphate regulon response regulator PhoB